jgi:hypothetical protein
MKRDAHGVDVPEDHQPLGTRAFRRRLKPGGLDHHPLVLACVDRISYAPHANAGHCILLDAGRPMWHSAGFLNTNEFVLWQYHNT